MKIAVLLSGGVDSSVALQLLKDEGHDLTAFYLKIWLEDEMAFMGDCPWEEDMSYVSAVCEQLDVPLEIVPLQTEYFDRVVSHAINELKRGRTPSPDILCNERIKFGAFFEEIGDGFDKVASGHYAQVIEKDGQYYLKQGPDPVKDQSYFLSNLRQDQLAKILFPIGSLQKSEVRELAQRYHLPTQSRRDSQGICFLGKIKYNEFVKYHLGEKDGDIVNIDTSEVLGRHKGVWFYTIGQRQGIGLSGGPWYVAEKDLDKNILYISHKEKRQPQFKNCFTITDMHWINEKEQLGKFLCKLRHGPSMVEAELTKLDTEGSYLVTLVESDPGIAAGQSAIFYRDSICYGGGVIDKPVEQ